MVVAVAVAAAAAAAILIPVHNYGSRNESRVSRQREGFSRHIGFAEMREKLSLVPRNLQAVFYYI